MKYLNRKTALWVLAFVAVATIARRVGQYEALDAARAASRAEIANLKEANDDLLISIANDKKAEKQRGGYQQIISKDEGYVEGVKDSKKCRAGNQDVCSFILMIEVSRLQYLTGRPDSSFNFLYDEHGNYKKNAQELLDQMDDNQKAVQ